MSGSDGEIVARGYDKVADDYEALESEDAPWPRLDRVRAFVADLPPNSLVLDIGCGNGVPATKELAGRHQVLGVDISPEQVARAKANVPAARGTAAVERRARPRSGTDLRLARRADVHQHHPHT